MFTMTGSVDPRALLLWYPLPYRFFLFCFFYGLSCLFCPPFPLFLALPVRFRLSCIPKIPAAYVKNSTLAAVGSNSLFHSSFSIPLSFPRLLYQLFYSWCAPDKTWLTRTSPLHFCLFLLPPPPASLSFSGLIRVRESDWAH